MSKIIVKPQRKVNVVSELLYVYNEQKDTVKTRKGDPSRLLNIRPSQLPFCAASFFIKHASRGLIDSMDMVGAFYVNIGTAVHTVVQDYLGTSGRFLANWECRICGKKTYVTSQHECCDFPMRYEEILISYKGVVGHIDAVFIDSQGKYWILDFKTTSSAGAASKLKNPGKVYEEQVLTYAVMLGLEHKIKVEGVMLMFIKRDNPSDPVVWCKTVTKSNLAEMKAKLISYKKWHRRVLDAETKEDALALLKQGKCANPYCKACTSSDIKHLILTAYKRGKSRGYLPIRGLATSK